MNKNYPMSALNPMQSLKTLNTVQFQLNGKYFPGDRFALEGMVSMIGLEDINVLLHYDFVYIISRYYMFTDKVRKCIIDECVDICKYSSTDSRIKGIIMHTDFPIKKELLNCTPDMELVNQEYKSYIWNRDRCLYALNHQLEVVELSIKAFYEDFVTTYDSDNQGCKIYLENTVRSMFDTGTVSGLAKILNDNSYLKSLFGLCVDTEHSYATTGDFPTELMIKELIDYGISVIVHLNAVPESVKPYSRKDSHSNTTITECSVMDLNFYLSFTSFLEKNSIPYIREVNNNTMNREIEQLTALGVY